ncbi:TetR/AcrR family transcriptional regulator [Pseudonocardia sp. GCM10023141]|uniref:TetR/AcrR family transcriptional regulator n=1 Tax=Pseudonocardia sp. GCM10023141 TaxID=3252653 RepID=UPI00361D11A3
MPRREDLADAAIATLAEQGMRGLTHRAVDRTAGVAEGSTSYYFRTRHALLEAIVERLAQVDTADALALTTAGAFTAEALDAVVDHWLTAGRNQMLARYELALESTRRPELRRAFEQAGGSIRTRLADVLARNGAGDRARADRLVAGIDGLIFDQLVGSGTRRMSRAERLAVIEGLLQGALGGRQQGGLPDV